MTRLYDPMPGDEPSPSPCHQAGRTLVACPDCRRDVSRLANECVHCGRPSPGGGRCGALAIGLAIALLTGGLVAIVALKPRCVTRAERAAETAWAEALRGRPAGCGFLGIMMRQPQEISFVAPESPAEDAGLRPGDRIVAVNGRRVEHFRDYLSAIWAKRPGERLTLSIERPHAASAGMPRSVAVWTIDVPLGRHPND